MRSFAVLPLLAVFLVSLCGSQVPPPPSDVSGTVYFDRNRNAIHDDCDVPARGVTVAALAESEPVITAVTNPDGEYTLTDVREGPALVTMSTDPDFIWPMSVMTDDGRGGVLVNIGLKNIDGIELGVTRLLPIPASETLVSGLIFEDIDRDGEVDLNECGIPGGWLTIPGRVDSEVFNAENGYFELSPGTKPEPLEVRLIPPCERVDCPSWIPVEDVDEDGCLTLTPQVTDHPRHFEVRAGYYQGEYPASIDGIVFGDRDHNGEWDVGETGISGVYVWGQTSRCIVGHIETQTDANGRFRLEGMPPGTHRLFHSIPPDAVATEIFSSELPPDGIAVQVGDGVTSVELGVDVYPGAFIEVVPFDDVNGDGVRSADERRVNNLSICAVEGAGPEGTHICADSNVGQDYTLGPLSPGDYSVQIGSGGMTGLLMPPPQRLTVSLPSGEFVSLDVPLHIIPPEEQLIHSDPGATPVELDICYSDPNFVRRPFEEGYDPGQPFYDSWQVDEADARAVYADDVFVTGVRHGYIWQALAGKHFSGEIRACHPGSATIYAGVVLYGVTPVTAMTDGEVTQVTLAGRTDAGITAIAIPSGAMVDPGGYIQPMPWVAIFVDESSTPIARCTSAGCEMF